VVLAIYRKNYPIQDIRPDPTYLNYNRDIPVLKALFPKAFENLPFKPLKFLDYWQNKNDVEKHDQKAAPNHGQ
jgi:hypothetical protein